MAPGNEETLRDLNKRPARPRDPIPGLPASANVQSEREEILSECEISWKRSCGWPVGHDCNHVRPLLESARDTHFSVAELLAKGRVPIQVGHILRIG